MSNQSYEIGGYFGFEPYSNCENFFVNGEIFFESARGAFYSLLQCGKPSKVYIPSYICDAMVKMLILSGIEFVFYNLDDEFEVPSNIKLKDDEWLLYVNYFGVCQHQIENLFNRYDKRQLVIDSSQAYFHSPLDCVATIYSPRKFMGIPDGGIIVTNISIPEPLNNHHLTDSEMNYLLKRSLVSAVSGYDSFIRSEKNFEVDFSRGISKFSYEILSKLDLNLYLQKRNNNFCTLNEKLKEINEINFDHLMVHGPLCYPLIINSKYASFAKAINEHLIKHSVYVPTYWPEVNQRERVSMFEKKLLKNSIFLPCDQRYDERDMLFVANLIFEFLGI